MAETALATSCGAGGRSDVYRRRRAEQTDGWILEDDYDSELRYAGRPLASIQGIDESERALYVGTFNKILFPGVRLAYLVLPSKLIEPIIRAKVIADGFTPPLLQAVLAEFIAEGLFSSHQRRVRKLCRDRRDRFISVAGEHLPDHVRVGPAEAGMHVALHLPDNVEDDEVSAEARRQGLAVPALSNHAIEGEGRGLLVHYGNAPLSEIERGTRRLGALLASPR